ncbi:MAG: lactonase family protein [Propionibacteriaceae bacterium]
MTEPAPTGTEIVQVGCFTSPPGSRAVGIHRFTLDGTALSPVPTPDPSYLLLHPTLPVLYALSERTPTSVSAFAVDAESGLSLINTIATGGDGGCHLGYDPVRQLVVVAHYGVGSVSVCSVNDDGSLDRTVDSIAFTGSGPDPDRQQAAHTHMAVPDGAEWLIADLGTDQIHRLTLDDAGTIIGTAEISTPPGVGPRHFVIIGDYLVLACELTGELWLARRDGDDWRGVAKVGSTATTTDEPVYPSAIVQAGDQIIVANRGPDTFATFALDPDDDTLTMIDETGTGGEWPRDLTWHHDQVWVANQNSESVTVFRRTEQSWTQTQQIDCPHPGCIVFTRH